MARFRLLTGLLVAPTLVLTMAAASPTPRSVPLPNDFQRT